jgi:hypothetical protein
MQTAKRQSLYDFGIIPKKIEGINYTGKKKLSATGQWPNGDLLTF